MQPVKHAVHGLCVGDGRPVMSHLGGVTVTTSFFTSPFHTCLTLPNAYGAAVSQVNMSIHGLRTQHGEGWSSKNSFRCNSTRRLVGAHVCKIRKL